MLTVLQYTTALLTEYLVNAFSTTTAYWEITLLWLSIHTVSYSILIQLVRAWNICTCNFFQLICLHNLPLQLGSNVAINNTICTLTEFNQLISCNFCQKLVWLFNITWHSSIYIWSNCCTTFFLTIHNLNIFSTANSGVTNTNHFSSHFS